VKHPLMLLYLSLVVLTVLVIMLAATIGAP
jgi:hypothetical protein